MGGHTPRVETLGLPWANSTEAGSPHPLPLEESASSLVFYAGGPETAGRGGGDAVGNGLSNRLEGAVTHPVPLPFHYSSLFWGLFSNEDTGGQS